MDEQEASVQIKKQDKDSDRGKNWSDEEVYDLIDIWSDDTVQEQLEEISMSIVRFLNVLKKRAILEPWTNVGKK